MYTKQGIRSVKHIGNVREIQEMFVLRLSGYSVNIRSFEKRFVKLFFAGTNVNGIKRRTGHRSWFKIPKCVAWTNVNGIN